MSQDDKDSGRIPAAPPSAAGPMAGGEDPCPWVMPNGDQESADGPGDGMEWGGGDINIHIDVNTNTDIHIIINMNIKYYIDDYALLIPY